MKKLIILIFLIIAIVFYFQDNNLNNKTKTLDFNINYKLLKNKPTIIIDEFSIFFPHYLREINVEEKKLLIDSFLFDSSRNNIELINSFTSDRKVICTLLRIDDKSLNFDFISKDIVKNVLSKINGNEFKKNKLEINEIESIQYLFKGNKNIVIKLFFKLNYYYQLDFIIPIQNYEEEIESIESSIGTLNKSKEK